MSESIGTKFVCVLKKNNRREVMKVAIIYVAKGQEDEVSILKNEKGSTEYELFVKSLGWEIDIGGHQGYLGGLEKNLATGKNAIYYCTSTLEMIFHDIIKIPKDMNDEKQVKRVKY